MIDPKVDPQGRLTIKLLTEHLEARKGYIEDLEKQVTQLKTEKVQLKDSKELTLGDIYEYWVKPGIKNDLRERPAFYTWCRCGYQNLKQWVTDGVEELRKPIFKNSTN